MSEEKDITLKEFIDENHKLISTLAILATLSTLAKTFGEEYGQFLAFLLFTLVLLVAAEIVGNFPYKSQRKLHWFGEIFSFSVLIFALVWIRTYYADLISFFFWALAFIIAILIFAGLAEGIRRLVLRVPWLQGRSQRVRDRVIPAFGAMLLLASAVLVFRHFLHK